MDPHELAERERLAQEEADRVKRDLPRIRLELGSDADGASPTESAGELGEEGQVGVEPDDT
jgi:hypothetical protein